MSDTLPAGAHRTNLSGNCSISGCPCRGWSAQETAVVAKEEKSEMSTKSACVLTGAATESAEDCSTHRHRIESHQPAARGGGDGPERIRVNVRAGKDDWIGIAYSSNAGDPSTIHEYVSINQHHSLVAELDTLKGDALALVAERERLLEAIKEVAVRSLRYCEQKYGHDDQARLNLEALVESVEQRSTSE